jgi:hypothetical protein
VQSVSPVVRREREVKPAADKARVRRAPGNPPDRRTHVGVHVRGVIVWRVKPQHYVAQRPVAIGHGEAHNAGPKSTQRQSGTR